MLMSPPIAPSISAIIKLRDSPIRRGPTRHASPIPHTPAIRTRSSPHSSSIVLNVVICVNVRQPIPARSCPCKRTGGQALSPSATHPPPKTLRKASPPSRKTSPFGICMLFVLSSLATHLTPSLLRISFCFSSFGPHIWPLPTSTGTLSRPLQDRRWIVVDVSE